MGHFYTFLANSDLVIQSVLQVDLVGDDSQSQARPRLRGKETARGAVLDEVEIEGRRRKGGTWRQAVTPLGPLCCGRCCAGLKPSRFLQRRSTVVLRHRGPLKTLVVTICRHT